MSSRTHDLQRWLRLAVALLALLFGTGVHEWLHSSGATPGRDGITQQIELHASDCEHHGPQVAAHDADCLICSSGSRQVALALAVGTAGFGRPGAMVAPATVCDVVRTSIIPGVLGARAPPVTIG